MICQPSFPCENVGKSPGVDDFWGRKLTIRKVEFITQNGAFTMNKWDFMGFDHEEIDCAPGGLGSYWDSMVVHGDF